MPVPVDKGKIKYFQINLTLIIKSNTGVAETGFMIPQADDIRVVLKNYLKYEL